MSYGISDWGSQSFEFKPHAASDGTSWAVAKVHEGSLGPEAVIPDAHLLFNGEFERAGADLILRDGHGKTVVVHDYFASDHLPQLLSPDGARLTPDVVAALAGPLAPGQYAQAAPVPSGSDAVGRVAKVVGDATVVRNGVVVALHVGDAILKGDVLRTGSGSLGVTFTDGSTLNLTPHARLVVNEFAYDAHSTSNSEVLNLVQGSLTFISGHVAHQGHMQINTPVATLGIRGTVGGATEATDGTVSFFVAESATGAVLTDNRGHVLADVLQGGPMVIVRPAGPLNVLAEEVQKAPAELARELAIVQQMVSLQSIGEQIIQQYLQPNNDNNPNPHSTTHPHTQIEIPLPNHADTGTGSGTGDAADHVTVSLHTTTIDDTGAPITWTQFIYVPVPSDLTSPSAPTISVLNHQTHGDLTNGGSINDATPTIHVSLVGTGAVAGDRVELFNGTNAIGGPVTLTAANISAGFLEFNTPALADGVYHLNVSISDTTGNTSVASNAFNFTLDTVAPTLAPVASVIYNDTAAPDHFGAKGGTLAGSDGSGSALTYGIVGGSADMAQNGYDTKLTGTYGTLHLNSTSGAYEFVSNDAAINGLSASTVENFTFTVSDAAGNSTQQNFSVTLNGVNDVPLIVGNASTSGVENDTLTAAAAAYLVADHHLVNGLGGPDGFGQNSLPANDDGSTGAINITSVFGSDGLNFFGHNYTSLYVNNNGNITFANPNGAYTPQHIDGGVNNPIIAPFWADVDTRGSSGPSNLVYYNLDSTNHVLTVTWDNVGYYAEHANSPDAFQLQLIGTGGGNFDIVFRYESINWTTGDASGGSGGLGGYVARAGYSAGDGVAGHYYELSGSGNQSAMLALPSTSGDTGIAGVQIFQVNSGSVTEASVASGTIQFADPDRADSHSASFVAENGGKHADGTAYVGTFALDDPVNNGSHVTEAANGVPGSVAWHFSMTSGQIDAIVFNSTITQSYDVAVADNHGASVSQTVSVSVGGPGNDTFVFHADTHVGADTIVNFHTGSDHIELDGYGFGSASDVIAAVTPNSHGDAVINLGHGDSLTVSGVTSDYLSAHPELVHLHTLA